MNIVFYKISRLIIVAGILLAGFNASASNSSNTNINATNSKVLVVATFSILQDMAIEIGGERVEVVSLIARKADAHTFEPSPKTVKQVSDARLLISNGLGFETWLNRLLQASNFNGLHLVASTGIKPLRFDDKHDDLHSHNHGDSHKHHNHNHQGVDPHAWQSLQNGVIYAKNIALALTEVDQSNADYYASRAEKYIQKIQKTDKQLQIDIDSIKPENRNVVTAHDAFAYFAKSYNVNFMSAAGISTQAEPSAQEIAKLIKLSSKLGKVAFFVEFGTNPRLIKQLAQELNMPVGAQLYSDTLDEASHQAGSYLGMLLWNVEQLVKNLK